MILRSSKFFGCCYADEIVEKQFFAKKFEAQLENDVLKISFVFVKGLDVVSINENLQKITFVEIEDSYLKNKLVNFLNDFPQIKKIKFLKGGVYYSVKNLKLTHKGFLLQLVY